MRRRGFLRLAGGGAAVAAQLKVLDFASSLFAGEAKSDEKPLVSVAFMLTTGGGGWYPSGTAEMRQQMRVDYEAILSEAAKALDVRLDIMPGGLDPAAYLERVQQTKPDGQIIMALNLHSLESKALHEVLKNRAGIPTIVYANVSTNRVSEFKQVPVEAGLFVGSTHDVNWLKYAMRMLSTLWRSQRLRILKCPDEGYAEAFAKAAASDELRAVADFYTRTAKQIVEPTAANILEAVKHYIALRSLVRDGKYDGVTVHGNICIGALGQKAKANPACLALSRLMDEGIPAACEHDAGAAKSQFLTLSLFDLPGMMGNTSADTVHRWIYVTHCTSATKLEGIHKEYRAPFVLRDFHNVGGGVAPMVAWPLGKRATVISSLGSFTPGVVAANTDDVRQPPCGGCRTTVAFALDGIRDVANARLAPHPWCVMADVVQPLLAYCQLSGQARVSDCSGNSLAASPRVTKDAWGSAMALA